MLLRKGKGILKSEKRLEEKGKLLEERDEALRKREVFLLDMEKSIHTFVDLFEVRATTYVCSILTNLNTHYFDLAKVKLA